MSYTTENAMTSKIQVAFLNLLLAVPALVRPPTLVVAQNSLNKQYFTDIFFKTDFKRYSDDVRELLLHVRGQKTPP